MYFNRSFTIKGKLKLHRENGNGNQESEDRSQRSEDRGQKSGVREESSSSSKSQCSPVIGRQKTEDRTVTCHPSSQYLSVLINFYPPKEGWPSGLRRRFAKPVQDNPYRGFESRLLRKQTEFCQKFCLFSHLPRTSCLIPYLIYFSKFCLF